MKTIPLTKGYAAMVDDEDYLALSQFKWQALLTRGGQPVYARRAGKTASGKKVTILMHAFICGYSRPDHVDGDGLNNQRLNLRLATHGQNNANRRKAHGKSSVFLGVNWKQTNNKWCAQIKQDGKKRHIGLFKDEFDAATAYNFAALEAHGDFARFNTPQ